jgi:hypothetical protein
MRDFDELNITQAVVDRFADTPDPRLKVEMTSLGSVEIHRELMTAAQR